DQAPASDQPSHRPVPDATDPDFALAYQSGFLCGKQGDGPTSRWSFEDRPYLLPQYDRGYQDGIAQAQRSPRGPDRPPEVRPLSKEEDERSKKSMEAQKEFVKWVTGQDGEDPHGHEEPHVTTLPKLPEGRSPAD